MNVLVFSHHINTWAGSETVCLELVEEFRAKGHSVSVSCPFASPSFVHDAIGDWRVLVGDVGCLNLCSFELIIVLHQGLSRMAEDHFEDLFNSARRPYIAYFHLSPYEPFELPGPFVEAALADAVFANSEETKAQLKQHGFREIELFQNPAPEAFEGVYKRTQKLSSILSVSNHPPPELSDAFEILKSQGVDVRRIGRPSNNRRLLPEDIAQSDALVTIGKTVQYGMRARRPVYCYDHFQGPGWLAPWGQKDEDLNFSGRSLQKKLSAEEIARQIQEGFAKATEWVGELESDGLVRFQLENFVDRLTEAAAQHSGRAWPSWTRESGWRERFKTERSLYYLVDRHYAQSNNLLPPHALHETRAAGRLPQCQIIRAPAKGEAMVIAVFSFRYDAALVPELIENISPAIHGYVAYDDTKSTVALSNEADRQLDLYDAAREMGADWIFPVDPDERFESALADKMRLLTSQGPVVWTFECREMFSETAYRVDGFWSHRPRVRLFPCYPGMEPDQERLHGEWTRNALKLPVRTSGLCFYHLRMACPMRRAMRKRLYASSDPYRAFQSIGYDYLDDERGMQLRTIQEERNFTPPFVDDWGLWGPEIERLGEASDSPDPFPNALRRLVRTRQMRGFESAAHFGRDMLADHPDDIELALMVAESALLAGNVGIALEIASGLVERSIEPLFANLLAYESFLKLGAANSAEEQIEKIEALTPKACHWHQLRQKLLPSHEEILRNDALWRRWISLIEPGRVTVRVGEEAVQRELGVILLCEGGSPNPARTVSSLRNQSVSCEIVVVSTGGGAVEQSLKEHIEAISLISIDALLCEGDARNIGIDACRARIVTFLPSGCVPEKNWVENLLAAHRDGFEVVSTSVEPGIIVSGPLLAGWAWLNDSPDTSVMNSVCTATCLSFNRGLFRQFGYFPLEQRVDVERNWISRIAGLVEISPPVSSVLKQVFEPSWESLLQDVGKQARLRASRDFGELFDSPDGLRTLALQESSQIRARLSVKSSQEAQDFNEHDLSELARVTELAIMDAGFDILEAKMLHREAEECLASEPARSLNLLQKAIELWPHSTELRMFEAECLLKLNHAKCRTASVTSAFKAFASDPGCTKAASFAVQTLVADKQFKLAYDILQWVWELNPTSEALAMVARFLPGPGFGPVRGLFFQRAFLLRPWNRQVNNQLMNMYVKLGEHSAAESRKLLISTFEAER